MDIYEDCIIYEEYSNNVTGVDNTKCFQKGKFLVDNLKFNAVLVEMSNAHEQRVNLKII